MSFRRQVPSLQTICLKRIGVYPKRSLQDGIVEECFYRAAYCKKKNKKRKLRHFPDLTRIRNKIIKELCETGKMQDDILPPSFLGADYRHLCVTNCRVTNVFLEAVAGTCSDALEAVNISGCFNVWDDGVGLLLRSCPRVKRLRANNCRKLTDRTFQYLVKYGANVRYLFFGGNFNMSVAGIINLIKKHPNRENFLELGLSGLGGEGIDSEVLEAVMEGCPRLERLHLGHSLPHALPALTLQSLPQNLPNLRVLSLHWCQGVDNEVLAQLGSSAPALREIDLTGIKQVSVQGVQAMIQQKLFGCQGGGAEWAEFESVSLQYTGITKQQVESLRLAYPNMKINGK